MDFSAVAAAARSGGLELAGYTSQAQFLVNCGITEVMSRTPAEDGGEVPAARQPGEPPDEPRGNGRAVQGDRARPGVFGAPLLGFREGDRRQAL